MGGPSVSWWRDITEWTRLVLALHTHETQKDEQCWPHQLISRQLIDYDEDSACLICLLQFPNDTNVRSIPALLLLFICRSPRGS